jgi:hypothetical protein
MESCVEIFTGQGFDPDGGPYQMVPSGGGVRFVKLVDGEGMTVDVDKPDVCEVVETDSRFRLHFPDPPTQNVCRPSQNVSRRSERFFKLIGENPGRCQVTAAKSYQSRDAHLTVAVKRKRPRLVAFTICSDGGGHVAQVDNELDIERYFQFAKNLWLNQANVEFVNHGIQRMPVTQDLGDTIWIKPGAGSPTAEAITGLAVPAVNVNVFFVWNVRVDGQPDVLEGITSESGDAIIIGGHLPDYYPNTLAHELGHHLGISGHALHLPRHLMYEKARGAASLLTSIDIDTGNP